MPNKKKRSIAGEANATKMIEHRGGARSGPYLGARNVSVYEKTPTKEKQVVTTAAATTTAMPRPRRRKGTPPLSPVEKRWFAVLRLLCLRSQHGGRSPGRQAAAIAKSIGVGVDSLNRITRDAVAGRSLVRKVGSGRVRVVRSEWMRDWLKRKHREVRGKWTVRRMTAEMKEEWGGIGSVGSVEQTIKENGFRRVRPRVLPILNARIMERRVEFARYLTDETGPMKDTDTFFGMLDEKWFYFNLLEKAVWIDKDEEKPTYFVKNKQFPTKVMFLGALGMPRPEHDFTGDIGLFPIGVLDFAQRNSVNRRAGTLVFEPMEIDRALTVHMLKHHILPQTLNRCKWAKRIVWVLDNAGGHGGGRGDMQTNVLDPINEWAKDLPQDIKALCGDPRHPPDIIFKAQSAHSPDLNILDNGAWWSLQVAVDRLNTQHSRVLAPTELQVHDAVMEAWEGWVSAERITMLFESVVMNAHRVIETHGGNTYSQPHHTDSTRK